MTRHAERPALTPLALVPDHLSKPGVAEPARKPTARTWTHGPAGLFASAGTRHGGGPAWLVLPAPTQTQGAATQPGGWSHAPPRVNHCPGLRMGPPESQSPGPTRPATWHTMPVLQQRNDARRTTGLRPLSPPRPGWWHWWCAQAQSPIMQPECRPGHRPAPTSSSNSRSLNITREELAAVVTVGGGRGALPSRGVRLPDPCAPLKRICAWRARPGPSLRTPL